MRHQQQHRGFFWWAVLAVGVVFFTWLWWAFFLSELFLAGVNENRLDQLGKLGDLFGGINALFTALAFAGVAVAAIFQFRTMQLTERQHAQQSFEPLLFHMLQLHRAIATSIELELTPYMQGRANWNGGPGAQSFDTAVNVLRDTIAIDLPSYANCPTTEDRRKLLRQTYASFYFQNESHLGPYFRSLYHVFKLIDESELDLKTKIRYANIARSTLDRNDIFLLAVNSATDYGEGFVPLIERYGLLKHVERDERFPDKFICDWFYQPTALMSAQQREDSKATHIISARSAA